MKRAWLWCGLVAATVGPIGFIGAEQSDDGFDVSGSIGKIDDAVLQAMRQARGDEQVPVLIFLSDRVNIRDMVRQFNAEGARLADRHERVVRALQQKAAETQGPLLEYLHSRADQAVVSGIKTFWIDNSIAVRATPQAILDIEARPEVGDIFYDYEIVPIEPVYVGPPEEGGNFRSGPEKGLVAIRAPDCWEIGVDGTGVLTSTLDTGVDVNHDALHDRWRGYDERYDGHPEWAWHDPIYGSDYPKDTYGHGTHTMGTVCGGEPGDEIGVAPGAQWITSSCINQGVGDKLIRDVKDAYQWLIDPDGDPSTNWDVPTANSNSWRLAPFFGYPKCDETFWESLDACEAAGIVILFSAGNEGPTDESLGNPPDRATTEYMCYAVGAIDANNDNWPIASFSSRGPSHCTEDGSEAIKPENAAPGVNVRSSVPGNSYAQYSGTSMASPHINGVVCLMRQVNPELPVDEVKQFLFDTAIDLGDEGDDNDYGHGMIDAYAAVQLAAESVGLKFIYPDGRPRYIDPTGGSVLRFEVTAGPKDEPVAGTGKFFVNIGSGFEEVALTQTGDNSYEGEFPRCSCGIIVKYYVSADGLSGKTYTHPAGAPNLYFSTEPFNSTGTVYYDDFESDNGWRTKKEGRVTSGWWQRGVPVNDPNWGHDPESDGDGSGQCWLTQNELGATDVDGGAVFLISPELNLKRGGGFRYYYYYKEEVDQDDSDMLLVELTSTGSDKGPWTEIARHTESNGLEWTQHEVTREEIETLGVKFTSKMLIRFTAMDRQGRSVVEAGVDGLEIIGPTCDDRKKTGDMNCDGSVDFDDIDPFVTALTDPSQYEAQYPDCRLLNGDVNGDQDVNFDDIDGFVECIVNGGC
jgi:subtilisin family serine protease